jgi:SAM-dependent methyltransferase
LQENNDNFLSMERFFESEQGHALAGEINHQLKRIVDKLSGGDFLTIGINPEIFDLNPSNYNYSYFLAPTELISGAGIVARVDKLPFANGCLDCVFAPLTLELSSSRMACLDEIHRVLRSTGYMILIGLNPMSFWGLASLVRKNNDFPANKGKFKSSFRLSSELAQINLVPLLISNFYYIPPVKSKHWLSKLSFLNEVGKMLWPYPAGFYMLVAQKLEDRIIGPVVTAEDTSFVLNQNII